MFKYFLAIKEELDSAYEDEDSNNAQVELSNPKMDIYEITY